MATARKYSVNDSSPGAEARYSTKTPRVILVHPSVSSLGYSFITPRWLFVLAQATPVELVGDPFLVDESIERLDPGMIRPGDIVGISIMTGSCQAGYRALRAAKAKGARVIVGGIHATVLPEEPLEMGADAVVTGNGDIVWRQVIEDAIANCLQKRYDGGQVPGPALLKARWDLLDPSRYLLPSLQTAVGCPENCNFCSVWITDGRQPRFRSVSAIVDEANQLHSLGFRFIVLADDNFSPATLGRIGREPLPESRKRLERLRAERLTFFDSYAQAAPENLYAIAQVTAEIATDEEYLCALRDKMRVRGVLVGVESFTPEGLRSANKQWNPSGQRMVTAIQNIQEHGIFVYCSIICGLESDTSETIRNMRRFTRDCGAAVAQFPIFGVYPGTKDFNEMMIDRRNRAVAGYVPRRRNKLVCDTFWLHAEAPERLFIHPRMSSSDLAAEVNSNRKIFYSLGESVRRTRSGLLGTLSFRWKCIYVLACVVFRHVYRAHGISFEQVLSSKQAAAARLFMRAIIYLLHRHRTTPAHRREAFSDCSSVL